MASGESTGKRPGHIPFNSRLIVTSVKISDDWVGDSICRVSDVSTKAGAATDPADLDYDQWMEILKEDCEIKEIDDEVVQYIPLSDPSHRILVTSERSWAACLQETLLSDPDAVCFKFRFGTPEHRKFGTPGGLHGCVKLTIFALGR
jgi:hypothetical protein